MITHCTTSHQRIAGASFQKCEGEKWFKMQLTNYMRQSNAPYEHHLQETIFLYFEFKSHSDETMKKRKLSVLESVLGFKLFRGYNDGKELVRKQSLHELTLIRESNIVLPLQDKIRKKKFKKSSIDFISKIPSAFNDQSCHNHFPLFLFDFENGILMIIFEIYHEELFVSENGIDYQTFHLLDENGDSLQIDSIGSVFCMKDQEMFVFSKKKILYSYHLSLDYNTDAITPHSSIHLQQGDLPMYFSKKDTLNVLNSSTGFIYRYNSSNDLQHRKLIQPIFPKSYIFDNLGKTDDDTFVSFDYKRIDDVLTVVIGFKNLVYFDSHDYYNEECGRDAQFFKFDFRIQKIYLLQTENLVYLILHSTKNGIFVVDSTSGFILKQFLEISNFIIDQDFIYLFNENNSLCQTFPLILLTSSTISESTLSSNQALRQTLEILAVKYRSLMTTIRKVNENLNILNIRRITRIMEIMKANSINNFVDLKEAGNDMALVSIDNLRLHWHNTLFESNLHSISSQISGLSEKYKLNLLKMGLNFDFQYASRFAYPLIVKNIRSHVVYQDYVAIQVLIENVSSQINAHQIHVILLNGEAQSHSWSETIETLQSENSLHITAITSVPRKNDIFSQGTVIYPYLICQYGELYKRGSKCIIPLNKVIVNTWLTTGHSNFLIPVCLYPYHVIFTIRSHRDSLIDLKRLIDFVLCKLLGFQYMMDYRYIHLYQKLFVECFECHSFEIKVYAFESRIQIDNLFESLKELLGKELKGTDECPFSIDKEMKWNKESNYRHRGQRSMNADGNINEKSSIDDQNENSDAIYSQAELLKRLQSFQMDLLKDQDDEDDIRDRDKYQMYRDLLTQLETSKSKLQILMHDLKDSSCHFLK